jgi:serine/threonine protein kinase
MIRPHVPLAAGTRLGPYEVLRPIGAGGMGEVYAARDMRLERSVALKVLPADRAADDEARARFGREARAIAALNHPNICALYDVGHSDGHDYLVMELLEGETLQQRLSLGPLDLHSLVDLALSIADALDAAHARGLIHRDLKPANIFLTSRGIPKILDFGLAKALVEPEYDVTRKADTPLTGLGTTVGTVAYMSPEQLRGERLDVRTDLFSFGLVLYEMATGRRAFAGTTSAVLAAAILGHDPEPPRAIRPELPARLDDVLLKTLEKDRTLRCQTAAELHADLARLKRELSTGSARPASVTADQTAPPAAVRLDAPASVAPTSAERATPAAASRPSLLTVVLGLVVIAAAAGAYEIGRGQSSGESSMTPSAQVPLDAPDVSTPSPDMDSEIRDFVQRQVAEALREAEMAPAAAIAAEQPAPRQPVADPPAAAAAPEDASADAGAADAARGGRGRAGRRGAGPLGALAVGLRGVPPQTYDLVVQAGDPVARDMAMQLRAALDAGGWVCASLSEVPATPGPFGVLVPRASPAAMAFVNWSRRAGFDSAYRVVPALPRMRIVIGAQQ